MKRTISIKIDKKVEVPEFFTYGDTYAYRLLPDDKVMAVGYGSMAPSISLDDSIRCVPDNLPWPEITEERFNELFNQTMNIIIEKSGVNI